MKSANTLECQQSIEALLTLSTMQKSEMAHSAYTMLKERFSGKKQFNLLQSAYAAKTIL
jgi:hypothetical protein